MQNTLEFLHVILDVYRYLYDYRREITRADRIDVTSVAMVKADVTSMTMVKAEVGALKTQQK